MYNPPEGLEVHLVRSCRLYPSLPLVPSYQLDLVVQVIQSNPEVPTSKIKLD